MGRSSRSRRESAGADALDDDRPMFPASRGGRAWQTTVNDPILNPLMVAAGIPKVGEESPEPRTFHTFRHCYARLMLEPPVSARSSGWPAS